MENNRIASVLFGLLCFVMNGQVTAVEAEEQLGMVVEGKVEYKKG